MPHAAICLLLDHLIGAGKQRRWHFKAERLGGFLVDDQLELSGLLDWKLGRLSALQNLVHEYSGPSVHFALRAEIGCEPAILCKVSPSANGRYSVTAR